MNVYFLQWWVNNVNICFKRILHYHMRHQCQCIFTVIRCNPYMVTQDNLWCIKRCPLTLCARTAYMDRYMGKFFQYLLVIAMFSHLAGGPCPHPWDSPEKKTNWSTGSCFYLCLFEKNAVQVSRRWENVPNCLVRSHKLPVLISQRDHIETPVWIPLLLYLRHDQHPISQRYSEMKR